jgi:hypothetical protein
MNRLIEMRIELNKLNRELNSMIIDKNLYKGDREYDALVRRIEKLESERNELYYKGVKKGVKP